MRNHYYNISSYIKIHKKLNDTTILFPTEFALEELLFLNANRHLFLYLTKIFEVIHKIFFIRIEMLNWDKSICMLFHKYLKYRSIRTVNIRVVVLNFFISALYIRDGNYTSLYIPKRSLTCDQKLYFKKFITHKIFLNLLLYICTLVDMYVWPYNFNSCKKSQRYSSLNWDIKK